MYSRPGFYAWIRHPQYVGLAILGLGTLLLWPRFLVLVSYVIMLFLYAWLAEWEEERCLARFGESYQKDSPTPGARPWVLFYLVMCGSASVEGSPRGRRR